MLITAFAQAQAQALADDILYQAIGGQAGIARVTADFVPRLRADPRIGEFFKETKLSELQKQLTDQLCVVSGGPCVYEGANMKDAHADMKIRKADFNAMVEVLQQSMDAQGIPVHRAEPPARPPGTDAPRRDQHALISA